MAGRRRTIYSTELADEICQRVSCGETLTAICKERQMPSRMTVWRWAQDRSEFDEKLEEAQKQQMRTWVDEIVALADDASADYMVVAAKKDIDPKTQCWVKFDRKHVDRVRQQIQARQWMMERLLPQFAPKQKFDVQHSYANMSEDQIKAELRVAYEATGMTREQFMDMLEEEPVLH